jgi:hypothetical protein
MALIPFNLDLRTDLSQVRLVMKRLFLVVLFMFSYDLGYAGWVALEKQYQPTGLETVYFDPNTIQREGGRVTLWQLTDIKWNSTTRFLSSKTHKEFDCEGSRVRVLQVIEFSRQMGTGRSTAGYIKNGGWQVIEMHSADHALSKTACQTR